MFGWIAVWFGLWVVVWIGVVHAGFRWVCGFWMGWFNGTSLLTGVLVCVLDCACSCIGLVWLCGRLRLV